MIPKRKVEVIEPISNALRSVKVDDILRHNKGRRGSKARWLVLLVLEFLYTTKCIPF